MDLVKVKTLIPAPSDGISAPEYTELRYALSATASTSDETTAPSVSGSWTPGMPLPNNTYPYVWMRSRLFERVGESWVLRSTTYTRVTGESGTSINVKMMVIGVYASTSDMPSGSRSGFALVADDGAHMYQQMTHSGMTYWQMVSLSSSVNDAVISQADGCLYVWTGEFWRNVGVFRGENGVSAYVHVAWAMTLDRTTADGKAYPSSFDVEKDSSKTYNYIGFLADNTAADSLDGSLYEWNDVRGKDAVVYYLTTTVPSIAADASGVPVNPNESITIRQWRRVGRNDATLSDDLVLRLYTVLNGFKTRFGQLDWGNSASFTSAQASGEDSILAELLDSDGYIVVSLSIPVIRQGIQGPAGYNSATIQLYRRSADSIHDANMQEALLYTFATKELSGNLSGWSRTIPTDSSDPIYVTAATAVSNTATCLIQPNQWSTPAKMADNGEHGVNTAPVFLYQRAASAPDRPYNDLVYSFATGLLSGGTEFWEQNIPDINGHPCWVIQATAASSSPTDIIKGRNAGNGCEWSMPHKLVEDGAPGQRGSMGRFPYYDGEYDNDRDYAFNSFSVPYVTVTDETTGQVYKYIRKQTDALEGVECIGIKPGVTQGYTNYWERMTSDFKYLVAEMVFAAFAKMANWIFNGNVMFSENGIGNGDYRNFGNGWMPNILLDSLTGYAHFGADKTRFNPDGSGWLANHNIVWDLLGNLNIAGLVRKKKTVITNANRDEYMTEVGKDTDSDGNEVPVYALDVLKAGNWIVLDGVQPGLYIKLPSMRYDGTYSDAEKDMARSLVGCSVIINSINHTYLCGFRKTHLRFCKSFDVHSSRYCLDDDSLNANQIVFSNVETVYLECILADVKDAYGRYREDIMWMAKVVIK